VFKQSLELEKDTLLYFNPIISKEDYLKHHNVQGVPSKPSEIILVEETIIFTLALES